LPEDFEHFAECVCSSVVDKRESVCNEAVQSSSRDALEFSKPSRYLHASTTAVLSATIETELGHEARLAYSSTVVTFSSSRHPQRQRRCQPDKKEDSVSTTRNLSMTCSKSLAEVLKNKVLKTPQIEWEQVGGFSFPNSAASRGTAR